MYELAANALPLAIVASTPLLLAVLGELVVQRSGIINLGIEGMMLVAALTAALSAHAANSVIAGFAGGIAGAACIALLFGVFTIALRTDQIVTGTAINLFALGATSFAWRELRVPSVPQLQFDAVVPLAWIAIPIALA